MGAILGMDISFSLGCFASIFLIEISIASRLPGRGEKIHDDSRVLDHRYSRIPDFCGHDLYGFFEAVEEWPGGPSRRFSGDHPPDWSLDHGGFRFHFEDRVDSSGMCHSPVATACSDHRRANIWIAGDDSFHGAQRALTRAILAGNLDQVRERLPLAGDLNKQYGDGETLLRFAVMNVGSGRP